MLKLATQNEQLSIPRHVSLLQHGKTETVMNNLNPEFVKKFVLSYIFEEQVFLKFEL